MIDYPSFVKEKLDGIISKMAEEPKLFVKNPNTDFTRDRKLTFKTIMNLMLSMGGNSLKSELLEYFDYDVKLATSSAFIQQRDKILISAFQYLMKEFTHSISGLKTYEGYRLLAADGTDSNICHNPNDVDTYFQTVPNTKGFNKLHINVLYDLYNKLYVDVLIQPGRKSNEYRALTDMVYRSNIPGDVLVLADRGYESYNVFAHMEEKGWKYAIRIKDIASTGILSAQKLPQEDEFDIDLNTILTKRQTIETKKTPEKYKILNVKSPFDYIDNDTNNYYPIKFRVVRFKITEYTFECIITNLDREKFPPQKIKELYNLRWGIETSFRELKYAIGLINFHSKKVDHITQEIYARLIMYNFCELITMNVVITQKATKHCYQVNFTLAIKVCKRYFKYSSNMTSLNVERLISMNILPIREGRSDPRKIKNKSFVSFLYRVA